MKTPEYREGKEVAKEFEGAMRRVFQTPKPQRDEKQPKKAAFREAKRKSDKD
jgi:hypothetical protein